MEGEGIAVDMLRLGAAGSAYLGPGREEFWLGP